MGFIDDQERQRKNAKRNHPSEKRIEKRTLGHQAENLMQIFDLPDV